MNPPPPKTVTSCSARSTIERRDSLGLSAGQAPGDPLLSVIIGELDPHRAAVGAGENNHLADRAVRPVLVLIISGSDFAAVHRNDFIALLEARSRSRPVRRDKDCL